MLVYVTQNWRSYMFFVLLPGFPLVMLTRLVMKPSTKRVVRHFCGAIGLDCYYYPDYRKLTHQLSKHYTTDFRIPPVWVSNNASLSSFVHEQNNVFLQVSFVPSLWQLLLWQEKEKTDSSTSNGHTCISETYGSNGHSHQNGTESNGRSDVFSKASYYNVILRHGGSLPFDIDVPTKFVTYTTMSWVALELIPHLFHGLGLCIWGWVFSRKFAF